MPEIICENMQRIIVVGHAGSGKTMMAIWIAKQLGLPHIELDALHWGPGWQPRDQAFIADVERLTQEPCWVLDGNYGKSRHISWARADTIIWLDYPLALIYWRLVKRTAKRVVSRQELWNENRETLWGAVFASDSLFAHVFKTRKSRPETYERLMRSEEYGHLRWVRLRTLRETHRWQGKLIDTQGTKKEPSNKG